MRESNQLKWLKIAGWLFIPYIMILFTFKKMGVARRTVGIIWAVFVLFATIASQSETPTANVATTETPITPAVAKTEASTQVKEPAVKEPAAVLEPAAEPATEPASTADWKSEIDKIASSNGSPTEKSDAAEALAKHYKSDAAESKEFETYIIDEFESGKYLTGLSDPKYALANIFKASVIENQNVNKPIGDFAFDFYQNSKYVYRGVDAPDSDAVKSNEEQMNKALAKINPSAAKTKTETDPQVTDIPGTLGMTTEEFRTAFNNRVDQLGASITIDNLEVKEGEVQDVFQYMFTEDLAMTGTVNKADGSVRDVLLLTQGKTEESSSNFLIIMGLLMMTTNPDAESNFAQTVSNELGLFDDGVNFSTIDNTTVQAGVKYHIQGSPQIGLMFSAGDPNDN
ncbi:hypothetical protein [Saccharibacillus kuerlensis]|uniref:Uncharacterized protein n=1 Tax=Saccharibacillus kuerlensis TaxID=459527 RepID=A0ABQ2KXN6_9BACL|nr:hypothetical protein [Saccharibacillus kuerlensis]GGN96374.1 hypothetical protein GCM10010969_13360 [Saccharibacillus kuerlensis]